MSKKLYIAHLTETNPFGRAFEVYSGKPAEAVHQLLKAKQGYVPKAAYKEGIGDIDFVWGKGGKNGYGFAHIIERRNLEGKDGWAFVRNISNIIRNGKVYTKEGAEHKDRIYIGLDDAELAIRLSWNKEAKTWLVSGYELKP